MNPLKFRLREALITGSVASILSLAAMAWRGHVERGRPLASVNAPSHWLWGRSALAEDGFSWRYTAIAMTIHHVCSIFWALLHQRYFGQGGPRHEIAGAAATSAAAAWVDLCVVPERLTPGFERRLSRRGLFAVYLAFGVGLAVGSRLARRR